MKKIVIVFLNLVLMSGFVAKAICQDSDKQEKVHAIQERIDLINGTMHIISQPEAGTHLIIQAPINSLP